MRIRITGPAAVTLNDVPRAMSAEVIGQLQGASSDLQCADYFDESLADLGVVGGNVVLRYDEDAQRFNVVSEFVSSMALDAAQLRELVRQTFGQWSDGIGEGCFDALMDRLAVEINLVPDDQAAVRAEQIDDGSIAPSVELAKAARDGDLATLRKLLAAGGDIEARLQKYTPLHLAILYGRTEAALELIERGADVNAADPNGNGPLRHAVLTNSLNDTDAVMIAIALLQRGAGADAESSGEDESLAELARMRDKRQLATLLEGRRR